ncbi:MAG: MmgE/PrpD family protein [Firmicutes bacterium]|nr:MmgE/PrpD family protein [Bacillota bacterium]
MENGYFERIAEHFARLEAEGIGPDALRFLRWSLLNYAGGSIYAAANGCCGELEAFYSAGRKGSGQAARWGSKELYAPADAAFLNAAAFASLELDDSTRGSVHPGSFIWSSVLAEYMQHGGDAGTLIKSVLLGYELMTRAALLGADKALELGLHPPGLFGALGSAASAAMMIAGSGDAGLKSADLKEASDGSNVSKETEIIINAVGLAASLMPLCPFTAFAEGSDAKDLYGGWGAYIGNMAAEAAVFGLTGPKHILSGIKSLGSIFKGEKGSEMPLGQPYMIEFLNVKEFSACYSVNPAVNAAKKLLKEQGIGPENIRSAALDSYPYSVDIDPGDAELNSTSARLSLAYCTAAALMGDEIDAELFTDIASRLEKYAPLMERISVRSFEPYGRGSDANRAAKLTVELSDGRQLSAEYSGGNVAGGSGEGLSDERLKKRFLKQSSPYLGNEKAEALADAILSFGPESDIDHIISTLKTL